MIPSRDRAALDLTYPGWRFAERRLARAMAAMIELEDPELSHYRQTMARVPKSLVTALVGHDRAVVLEWNAALAQRALVAPLMTSTPVVPYVRQRPAGREG